MVLHKWDNSSNIQPKFYRKSEFRKSGYRERNLRINAIWIFYVPCKIVVMCEFYGRLMYSSMGLFPERFFPPTRINDPDMHHATCVTHVQWCIPGSLISGFLWSRWRGKRSRHARRMRNPHFYVSGKRPMDVCFLGPEQHITNLLMPRRGKNFPHYWPFGWEIHWSLVISPHEGLATSLFPLLLTRTVE